MLLLLTIAAVWTLALVALVGICRAAARGDRLQNTQLRMERMRRLAQHELPLAA